ncbi:MAG TPA: hypothetical protein VFU33_04525 [Gaiellaceae bacterium]|nr:hypothetical protein [Gaiellaceae bacterium]
MAPRGRETFAFLDRLRLEVRGDARALAHFRAEYRAARVDSAPVPEIIVSFGRAVADSPRGFTGNYRSLRWRVALDDADDTPLRATIDLRGAPRSFGLSLLQGYVVEPLLALLAPAAGRVLLPAAAVASEEGALLLLGRSRSGKSSLVARAAAAGTAVLGDDHVLVGADGCRAFPRRLRLYPDVAATAPTARAALPAPTRALLRGLGLVRRATGGAVAPPVRIPVETVGVVYRDPLPLGRVVVLERREVPRLVAEPLSRDELVATAGAVLQEQRRALDAVDDARWRGLFARVRTREESLLNDAFARVSSVERLVVPTRLPAGESVASIAAELSAGF